MDPQALQDSLHQEQTARAVSSSAVLAYVEAAGNFSRLAKRIQLQHIAQMEISTALTDLRQQSAGSSSPLSVLLLTCLAVVPAGLGLSFFCQVSAFKVRLERFEPLCGQERTYPARRVGSSWRRCLFFFPSLPLQ